MGIAVCIFTCSYVQISHPLFLNKVTECDSSSFNIEGILLLFGEVMLQVQHACFNEFPDQCAGCPDYRENRLDESSQFMWLAGMVSTNPPYVGRVVKECKRYHKRKVDYLR